MSGSPWLWLLIVTVSIVVSNALVLGVVAFLPADFFLDPPETAPARGRDGPRGTLHWVRRLVRNLVGLVLIVAGVLLSLPGIPGPGLLLAVLGVVLVDFPAKRRLARKLLGRPGALHTVNRLRVALGRPPLIPPGGTCDEETS